MMKISILGTGMVGRALAGRVSALGYEVFMGTRNPEIKLKNTPGDGETGFGEWYRDHPEVKLMSLDHLPPDTELFINATNGQASLLALESVGVDKLDGKIILDIANPLDFSQGMPPSLSVCNTDSLGEMIQRTFPSSQVVKALNTMNAHLMVNPDRIPGDHNVFVSGNDMVAKEQVKSFLMDLGWKSKNILDLGDISTARGTEMLLPVWLRLWGALGTPEFNFHIVKE